MNPTGTATGTRRKKPIRFTATAGMHLGVMLSLAIHPIALAADSVISSGTVVLRIVPPRVTEIRDGSTTDCSRAPGDGNGRGRPGARGLVQIFGIGLAGATAIRFEDEDVRGEIVGVLGSDGLNPSLLVKITIAERASWGPRRFTLITPDGAITSGEVVFIVQPPEIIDFGDPEGAPGSSGRVDVCGIGLDEVVEARLSGSGVTATVDPPPASEGARALNPTLSLTLRISSDAAPGPRSVTLRTARGEVTTRDVAFTIVPPRIDALLEGNNFLGGRDFSPSGEGAPGTSGRVFVMGTGLGGATAMQFAVSGITATIEPIPAEEQEKLNPLIPVQLSIDSSAPLGEHPFSLIIPRPPGVVRSADTNVSLTVTPPRIDFIADGHNLSQASPGACGMAFVGGVGVRDLTAVTFDDPGGIDARVIVRNDGPFILNEPAPIQLTVAATAVLGSRTFSVTTPRSRVGSGTTVFTVSPPQILLLSTETGPASPSALVAVRGRSVVRRGRDELLPLTGKDREDRLRRRLADIVRSIPLRGDRTASAGQLLPSLGDEAAPGSRGQVLILGVGLLEATDIQFAGGGIRASMPTVREPELNPALWVTMEIEKQAALGERAFVLRLTGFNPSCR
ncbi:MAG TPA: hypothetical protein VNM72_05785 [Blastocatellia bacterium]|nr:hypothetical protein [Blastocatellia bacterium]